MFNIGPFELAVLAVVALLVVGPEKLPGLVREAAQFIRTLRELATGARKQLQDELGPEFADVDLRSLNPRTALTKAVFGDDYDPSRLNPRTRVRDAVLGDEDLQAVDPRSSLRDAREDFRWRKGDASAVALDAEVDPTPGLGVSADDVDERPISVVKPQSAPNGAVRPRPRPSPRPRGFDDVT